MGEPIKLTGRPLSEREKRNKKIEARLTQTEYQLVLAMGKEFGLSKTALVKMRVLGGTEYLLVNSKELLSQMDELGAELSRIGNNINQLAKHANLMKLQGDVPFYVAEKFNSLLEQYLDNQQRMEAVFRKIIRLAGK